MSDDYLKLQLLSRVHPRTSFYGVLREKTEAPKTESPYYPDRDSSKIHQVKGTPEETNWKKVSLSRQEMIDQVNQGELEGRALTEHNLKKMRII